MYGKDSCNGFCEQGRSPRKQLGRAHRYINVNQVVQEKLHFFIKWMLSCLLMRECGTVNNESTVDLAVAKIFAVSFLRVPKKIVFFRNALQGPINGSIFLENRIIVIQLAGPLMSHFTLFFSTESYKNANYIAWSLGENHSILLYDYSYEVRNDYFFSLLDISQHKLKTKNL